MWASCWTLTQILRAWRMCQPTLLSWACGSEGENPAFFRQRRISLTATIHTKINDTAKKGWRDERKEGMKGHGGTSRKMRVFWAAGFQPLLTPSSLCFLCAELGSGVRHLRVSFLFPGLYTETPKVVSGVAYKKTHSCAQLEMLFPRLIFVILNCVCLSVRVCAF